MAAKRDQTPAPQENRKASGYEQDIGEPATQSGNIDDPALEHVKKTGRHAKRIEGVTETPQRSALITTPAPSASEALMKKRNMLFL